MFGTKVNGQWWKTDEGADVGDYIPVAWGTYMAPPTEVSVVVAEVPTQHLTASLNGHTVTYRPVPETEVDWCDLTENASVPWSALSVESCSGRGRCAAVAHRQRRRVQDGSGPNRGHGGSAGGFTVLSPWLGPRPQRSKSSVSRRSQPSSRTERRWRAPGSSDRAGRGRPTRAAGAVRDRPGHQNRHGDHVGGRSAQLHAGPTRTCEAADRCEQTRHSGTDPLEERRTGGSGRRIGMLVGMEQVRRPSDGELCGHVELRDGAMAGARRVGAGARPPLDSRRCRQPRLSEGLGVARRSLDAAESGRLRRSRVHSWRRRTDSHVGARLLRDDPVRQP